MEEIKKNSDQDLFQFLEDELKLFEETGESFSQIILIVQILIMSLVLDNSSHFDPFSN